MSNLLSIHKAAEYLDVTEDCLRKWDKDGKLKPFKTAGGHRRYKQEDLDKMVGIEETTDEQVISCATYARVSSNEQKQKGDLDRQSQRLSEYCAKHNLMVSHM